MDEFDKAGLVLTEDVKARLRGLMARCDLSMAALVAMLTAQGDAATAVADLAAAIARVNAAYQRTLVRPRTWRDILPTERT